MDREKEKETMKGNSRVKFRVTSGGLRISTAAAQFARLWSVDTGVFAVRERPAEEQIYYVTSRA